MKAKRTKPVTTTIEQVLGRRIRQLRGSRGLSQRQLAEALRGIGSPLGHKATVAKIEAKVDTDDTDTPTSIPSRAVKVSELLDLACVLYVPPMALLTPADPNERVQTPWGVLHAWDLHARIDPSDAYMRAAGWDGQYAMGSGLGKIMQRRGQLERSDDTPTMANFDLEDWEPTVVSEDKE